ncbi:GNAT family N-acetyltransferase [Pseudomonas sp. nanlin1]|uniref:GNAT family N-acetyltransferase n=1 Tax=Pseudomonas sp. nanlin1 TaxID=3040605 RepID=UPI00388D5165
MSPIIQRLTRHHASAYRALMLEAYRLHADAFTSTVSERETLPMGWWERRLDSGPDPDEVVFAAVEGEKLLGVAGLSVQRRSKARHKSTLFGMYVPLAHRGRGIGEQLVRAVLAYAQAQPQLLLVQLTVTEGNSGAQGLYARLGFKTFGVEPLAVAVGQGFVAKVHMWHALSKADAPR